MQKNDIFWFLIYRALWGEIIRIFGKFLDFCHFLTFFWLFSGCARHNIVPWIGLRDAQMGLKILSQQGNSVELTFQPAWYSKSKGYFSGVFGVIMSLKIQTLDKKLHFVQRNCVKNVLKRVYQKSKFRHFPEFCLTFQRENRLILSQICKKWYFLFFHL